MLSDRIKEVFPTNPLPVEFFRSDVALAQPDIPLELRQRLQGKRWTEVTFYDWQMLGAPIVSIISYMTPTAFKYYLPSLLTASIGHPELAVDMAVEALLPANNSRKPRGVWWREFYDNFDDQQKIVVREYLDHVADSAPAGSAQRALAIAGLDEVWR
jgi:hypothetical protein